jgi:hypothetical protein
VFIVDIVSLSSIQSELALSILHCRGRKSFDLLAKNIETRDIWVRGLQMLISETFGISYRRITDLYVSLLYRVRSLFLVLDGSKVYLTKPIVIEMVFYVNVKFIDYCRN